MLYFSEKVVENFKQEIYKDKMFKRYSHDEYRIRGDANAQMLFEFLAQNTLVEWGHMKLGQTSMNFNALNYVTTSHDIDHESGIAFYLATDFLYGIYFIREQIHNHHNGSFPSAGDYRVQSYLKSMNPNIKTSI